jgi:L-seryl-tRNA(Ser) seleniumtransferase
MTAPYERLGLRPIINASGSVTRLGGARMPDAVLAAFLDAARDTVPLEQLQAAASRRIAEVTGAEAGLVTAGSAASLELGAAAILAGLDPALMERLPDTRGMKCEFIVAREQRNGYDHAVRAAGGRLVEVGFNEIVGNAGVRRTELWEYAAAIGPETAGILFNHSPSSRRSLPELVDLAHRHGLKVLVDAAGELPPRSNLRDIVATGADLVGFSGGKAIRGPQSTGLLCGRRDLIASAALQMLDNDDHPELWDPPADFIDRSRLAGLPRHGLGRSLKVSKEEIVALLTALELFSDGSYDADLPRFRLWLEEIAAGLVDSGAVCRMIESRNGQTPPRLEIDLSPIADDARSAAFAACRALRQGDPPAYVGHGQLDDGVLVVNPFCLQGSQIASLAQCLREVVPLAVTHRDSRSHESRSGSAS